MKECFKCNQEKPLDYFYKHRGMSDGHLNKCKTCTKLDTKTRRDELSNNENWVETEKARHREKYYRLNYKEKHNPTPEQKVINMNKYRQRYPEKYKAKTASQRINVQTKGNHKHHWSYNEEHWKDVIELTPKDHATIHRFIIYDQERMMYRTLNGILLDTKEASIEYYEYVIQIEVK